MATDSLSTTSPSASATAPALVRRFEDTTLPKEEWTHAAHLTVALYYVTHHGREAAANQMREGIKRFNAAKGGDPAAYHETITLAWIAVVTRFLKNVESHGDARTFDELARVLVAQCGDKRYLLRFYARETLMSEAARTGWIAPDIAPIEAADTDESTHTPYATNEPDALPRA